MEPHPSEMQVLAGGCHCGRVRFLVQSARAVTALDCDCSICRMTGFLHLIVPRLRFELVSGEDSLVDYRFNTGVARHRFCGVCGIKAFYVPRSNPDGIDVNVRCLDAGQDLEVRIETFAGSEWEQHAAALSHLTEDAAPPPA